MNNILFVKRCILSSYITCILFFAYACKKDPPPQQTYPCGNVTELINYDTVTFQPTPYTLQLPPNLSSNGFTNVSYNPLTVEGIRLGKKLFFEKMLSLDTTQSCGSCHAQSLAFTDHNKQFSVGVLGQEGNRNAMPLFNLNWQDHFFWDGRATSLEDQALQPVPNPIEMHLQWEEAVCRLNNNANYRWLTYKAFGAKEITKEHAANAIAQFEKTLISGTSKFDLASTPGTGIELTDEEYLGYSLFFTENGDCFHCHGGPDNLFTDRQFHNNGLDAIVPPNDFKDKGLGQVTNNPANMGLFKTPSLRNVAVTAPYMHDGRFQTLEQVIDHYSEHIQNSPTLSPIILAKFPTGLHLTPEQKSAILAFLNTLTDTTFLNNPAFKE